MYHIQNKEVPHVVRRGDLNWEWTAFNTKGLAIPEQKWRAAQRTEVEILFDLLNQALEMQDKEATCRYFDALENLRLDPQDLPRGQFNATHALFGRFYLAFIAERQNDSSLEDPDQRKFRGDFGRLVFRGEIEVKMPLESKQKVLPETMLAFKEVWRI